nr:hypothetical protein CFP56_14628 [Quercus suber]
MDFREQAFQPPFQRAVFRALVELAQEMAAGAQGVVGEFERGEAEHDIDDVLSLASPVAGGRVFRVPIPISVLIWPIRALPAPLAHKSSDLLADPLTQKVALQRAHAARRLGGDDIDPDYAAAAAAGLHFRERDLTPAARREAKIDDSVPAREEVVARVDVEEFVGSARLETGELGGARVGVAGLARFPASGRGGGGGAQKVGRRDGLEAGQVDEEWYGRSSELEAGAERRCQHRMERLRDRKVELVDEK